MTNSSRSLGTPFGGKQAAPRVDLGGEESFRQLVNGIRDYAILSLDVEGQVSTWNAGAERIKGYRADEIIGRHFSTFYTEEDIAAGKPAMELATATTEGRYEEEG